MITLKIFDRKVKVRAFTEMLTSEYLKMEGKLNVVDYIALQIGKGPLDLFAVKMSPKVVHRIDNIDIHALDLRSLTYKKKIYTGFGAMVYGVHYFTDIIFRRNQENVNLWAFATMVSFKETGGFDMGKITVVYEDLMKMRAMDVVPIMNLFLATYNKKKVLTIKNLKLSLRMSPKVGRTLIQQLWSFTLQKIKFRRSRKYWEKNS